MQYSTTSDDLYICVVCLERPCNVAAEGCGHELCVKCALYLCSTSNIPTETTGPPGSVPYPLCRHGIISFIKLLGSSPTKDPKLSMSLSLCILHPHDENQPPCVPDVRKNRVASVSTNYLYPVTCSPLDDPPVPWTRPELPLTRSQTKSFMERLNTYMAAWSKDRHEEDADQITRSGYTLLTTRAPPRQLGQMPTPEPECPE